MSTKTAQRTPTARQYRIMGLLLVEDAEHYLLKPGAVDAERIAAAIMESGMVGPKRAALQFYAETITRILEEVKVLQRAAERH